MAVLSDTVRAEITAEIESAISRSHASVGTMLSEDIRAFVDATDDWQDAGAASFNSSLPAKAQTELTAALKSNGFRRVAKAREEAN